MIKEMLELRDLLTKVTKNTKEYCHKGDLVGIRGSLQIIEEKLYVVADKLTFLSSAKKEEK